ncbi:MAG: FHA domain-containing protein [Gammaproteobacteria bacterium]
MMDANSACQTVLLIRLWMPDAPESSTAGLPQAQLEEQLAFVEAALLDCGLCRGTRISNNALIGLFPTADSAFGVACSVQQACREHGHGSLLADVRILVDRQAGDLAGDIAPSTAGRVRELAEQLLEQVPPGQIFATRTICGHLSELSHARFQLYEQDAAGTETGEQLCQVICNEETVTRLAIPTQYQESTSTTRSLNLRWRDNTMTLTPESPSQTIGRGDQSDIQIESELASRSHARLGFQQTNFILTDQSTNGTFVQIDNDDEVFLHHEQIVLRSSGVISLGRHIRAGRGKLIYFKLTTGEPA